MADTIRSLLATAASDRNQRWVRRALQVAVELELSTIPPYLCAMWSIIDQRGGVYQSLNDIVIEEMGHLGAALNLLTAVGGKPRINNRTRVPRYPTSLPGGIKPGLVVPLQPIAKNAVGNTFMQIEFPDAEAVTVYQSKTYDTIGAFYRAISAALKDPQISISPNHQVVGQLGLVAITCRCLAQKAIDKIRDEGEGAHGSPFVSINRPAHYYRFAEMFWERRIKPCGDGGWGFCGPRLPFPKPQQIYAMAPVPKGGYPNVRQAVAFDRHYTAILNKLQAAWTTNGNPEPYLNAAVNIMIDDSPSGMVALARKLMQMARPDGVGCYGPAFCYRQ